MTVIFCVIRLSPSVFQAFFVDWWMLPHPPAANGDLWRLPPLKIFYFYFFIFFYQNELVGVNGLLGTLVLGGDVIIRACGFFAGLGKKD